MSKSVDPGGKCAPLAVRLFKCFITVVTLGEEVIPRALWNICGGAISVSISGSTVKPEAPN